MTWQVTRTELAGGAGQRIAIYDGGAALSVGDVLDDWCHANRFCSVLSDTPYGAFFWETPPLRVGDMGRSFDCVMLDAPGLAAIPPDPADFAALFAAGTSRAIAFRNLSGDAILIAPLPLAEAAAYGHLGAFVRLAQRQQVDDCFKLLASTLRGALNGTLRWASTAGLGVPWLHLRIDSRPKYYRFPEFRNPDWFARG